MKIPAMSVGLSHAARNFVKNNHKQAGILWCKGAIQSREVFLIEHTKVMEKVTACFSPHSVSLVALLPHRAVTSMIRFRQKKGD